MGLKTSDEALKALPQMLETEEKERTGESIDCIAASWLSVSYWQINPIASGTRGATPAEAAGPPLIHTASSKGASTSEVSVFLLPCKMPDGNGNFAGRSRLSCPVASFHRFKKGTCQGAKCISAPGVHV